MKTLPTRLLSILFPPILAVGLILASLFFVSQENQRWVLSLGLGAFLWLTGALLFITRRTSAFTRKLKQVTLNLASGEYEKSIHLKGSQEIEELATTLNTLRACLLENSSQLKHSPLSREKLYGEYECAELLQYEMFDKSLENAPSEKWIIRTPSLRSSPIFGLSIHWEGDRIQLKEAEVEGFHGIFKLLTEGTSKKLSLDLKTGTALSQNFPEALLWSEKEGRLQPFRKPDIHDIVILFNSGLIRQMPNPHLMRDWLTKILRHFAKDGLDLTSAMLESELNFFAKKYVHNEDIKIILLTLKPDSKIP